MFHVGATLHSLARHDFTLNCRWCEMKWIGEKAPCFCDLVALTFLMGHLANGREVESTLQVPLPFVQAAHVVCSRIPSYVYFLGCFLMLMTLPLLDLEQKRWKKNAGKMSASDIQNILRQNAWPWYPKKPKDRLCRHTAAHYMALLYPQGENTEAPVDASNKVSTLEKEGLVSLCRCLDIWLRQVGWPTSPQLGLIISTLMSLYAESCNSHFGSATSKRMVHWSSVLDVKCVATLMCYDVVNSQRMDATWVSKFQILQG